MTDVIWLMMLITVVLIPIAGMFPLGHIAVQKAKNVEVGLYIANEFINRLEKHFPSQTALNHDVAPLVTTSTDVIGQPPNAITYGVSQSIWEVEQRKWLYNTVTVTECDICDVQIVVTFPKGAPFQYTTRLYKDLALFDIQ